MSFSDDIETDLSRRDFTVNAMALRLPEPVLVDPHGGVSPAELDRAEAAFADSEADDLAGKVGAVVGDAEDQARQTRRRAQRDRAARKVTRASSAKP